MGPAHRSTPALQASIVDSTGDMSTAGLVAICSLAYLSVVAWVLQGVRLRPDRQRLGGLPGVRQTYRRRCGSGVNAALFYCLIVIQTQCVLPSDSVAMSFQVPAV